MIKKIIHTGNIVNPQRIRVILSHGLMQCQFKKMAHLKLEQLVEVLKPHLSKSLRLWKNALREYDEEETNK